ncbi:MAG: carbohydrate kinase [Tannerella sp.]|nr:carbohydrate kinase [Tannerella sp.]
MMKTIAGIGEIYWDLYPELKTPGGAPAHLAFHAAQFGFDGCVVSAVGNDADGKALTDCLTRKRIRHEIALADCPTDAVQVTIDEDGDTHREIPENAAWDYIPTTARIENLARSCDAVCFGSLAQRSETSRATIYRFLELMPDDAPKIFDINLRQHFYSREIIHESLLRCNILKATGDEMNVLSNLFKRAETPPDEICLQLLEDYKLQMIIETKGEDGSSIYTEEERLWIYAPRVQVADTAGAGDSFTATFLAALLSGESARNAHRLASNVSAYVCSQHGAMPELPQAFVESLKPRGKQ